MPGLFDKIAKDLQDSVLTLSEKAAEWFKTGAETLRGGVELASAKAAQASRFAKLKWEQNLLQREIEKAFTALGGQVYELFSTGQLPTLEEAARDKFELLRELEAKLAAKEKEIERLSREQDAAAGQAGMKDLRQDLEGAGGTIMQLTITAQAFAANKALQEIALPQDLVIGAVLRGEDMIMPARETVLMPGDRVTLLGKKEAVQQAARLLAG